MQHISKINKYELRAERKGEQIPTQLCLDGPRLGVVCEAIRGEGLREVTLASFRLNRKSQGKEWGKGTKERGRHGPRPEPGGCSLVGLCWGRGCRRPQGAKF